MANIHRPGSPGVSLVFALGFGLTALVGVVMVNASLSRTISAELSQEAPTFFFMDVRPDQVENFRSLVLSTPGVSRLDLRPMVRGRIVRIGQTPVENATVSEDVAWAHRELMEQAANLPPTDAYLIIGGDNAVLEESRDLVERFRPDLLPHCALQGHDSFVSSAKAQRAFGYRARYTWREYL